MRRTSDSSSSSNVKSSSHAITQQTSTVSQHTDDDDDDDSGDGGGGDDDSGGGGGDEGYVVIDNERSSVVSVADKNVDKLLKCVADNDIQMVSPLVFAHFVVCKLSTSYVQSLSLPFSTCGYRRLIMYTSCEIP